MTSPYREQPAVKEFTVEMPKKLTFNDLAKLGIYSEKIYMLLSKLDRSVHNQWHGDVNEAIDVFEKLKTDACERLHKQCDHISFLDDEEQRACDECAAIVKTINGLTFDDMREMLRAKSAQAKLSATDVYVETKVQPQVKSKAGPVALGLIISTFIIFTITWFFEYYNK